MKIILERPKPPKPGQWKNPRGQTLNISESLPFYRSNYSQRIHRIRSGGHHLFDGEYRHSHFHFWCGGTGFSGKGELFDNPPDRAVFCATCEGRAIGAGMCGAREIAGRTVIFQPREPRGSRKPKLNKR